MQVPCSASMEGLGMSSNVFPPGTIPSKACSLLFFMYASSSHMYHLKDPEQWSWLWLDLFFIPLNCFWPLCYPGRWLSRFVYCELIPTGSVMVWISIKSVHDTRPHWQLNEQPHCRTVSCERKCTVSGMFTDEIWTASNIVKMMDHNCMLSICWPTQTDILWNSTKLFPFFVSFTLWRL